MRLLPSIHITAVWLIVSHRKCVDQIWYCVDIPSSPALTRMVVLCISSHCLCPLDESLNSRHFRNVNIFEQLMSFYSSKQPLLPPSMVKQRSMRDEACVHLLCLKGRMFVEHADWSFGIQLQYMCGMSLKYESMLAGLSARVFVHVSMWDSYLVCLDLLADFPLCRQEELSLQLSLGFCGSRHKSVELLGELIPSYVPKTLIDQAKTCILFSRDLSMNPVFCLDWIWKMDEIAVT